MIQGIMGMMHGMPVFIDPYLPRFKTVQYRFPRTKSKRIRNKWAKRQGNFKQIPVRALHIFEGKRIFVHPADFAEMKHLITPNCV